MKHTTISILLAALGMLSCTREARLVILHTNDTHSHIEPERGGEYSGRGGSIERAAFVDSIRAAEGADKVLLLHAGDFSQGTPYFSELGGRAEIEIMNGIGYDCTCLGNHEFDNGVEALCERLSSLSTTVVCANLDLSDSPLKDFVRPSVIIERGGMKIGIIGLVVNLKASVKSEVSGALKVLDNREVVNAEAAKLRAEGCDFVILLTHIGYSEDTALAREIKGVDLIVGGHSHTRCDGLKYIKDAEGRKVPVISDGQWGREMGVIKVY